MAGRLSRQSTGRYCLTSFGSADILTPHCARQIMINSVQHRWFLLPLLVLSLHQGWAQAPSGPVSFSFNSQNTAVYDLSNPAGYNLTQTLIGVGGTPITLSIFGMPVTHNSGGRLVGSGECQVALGDDQAVAAHYTVSGHVSGGGNRATRVQFTVRLTGNDVVTGVQTPFNISISYNLQVQVDEEAQTFAMVGTARGAASFTKLGGARIRSDDMFVPLPANVFGNWTAQFEVATLGHLSGSGNLVLSNGRTLPVKLSGGFASGSQLTRLHSTGTTHQDFGGPFLDGRGSSVQMNFFINAEQPALMHGTILGQKVLID